ncbi:LEM3 CDC50 family protein [Aspergillus sp. HF37]|nr:LEM3 CDC50 family protein [Aspergillus sp. HF37]
MAQAETTRPESLDEQDPRREDGDKKPKTRRPANTAFRQQRLKAWQPILSPRSVLPLFFVIGIIFAPIGGLLLWASEEVEELLMDYSTCTRDAPDAREEDAKPMPSSNVQASFKSAKQMGPTLWQRSGQNGTEICSLIFDIPNDIGPPVFMYYRMKEFYQNHRRYVQSLDLDQLKGIPVSNKSIKTGTCDPLTVDPDSGKAYYPCGLIANSIFNDTIPSPYRVGTNLEDYFMTNKGIAWDSDKQLMKNTQYKPWEVVPPPYWRKKYGNHYTNETLPQINEDEEFMVWMRTAGLPHFSKLSRRNDTATMSAGTYRLDIGSYFPVHKYSGTKVILISTRSIVGGKNPFMGIAYVVVGGICVLMGSLFAIAHLVRPRKLGDHTYLTWNNEQPSTATATGRDDRFGSQAP